ncbi:MAG TPA: hypothetical protein VJT74_04325 [Pyrinomonadaceae bacterium]|nr:hypothetical protein [Pyrinomonadaceae bacterium]
MKKLQQICASIVLMLALALSCAAGDISMPGATSSTSTQKSSVMGDISMPGATAGGDILLPEVEAIDPMMETALSFLQSLLSLF